jgi:hypothetical protein
MASSRHNILSALKSNLIEIGLTGWYGLLGTAMTTGAPIIGKINPAMSIACAVLPVLSRCVQTEEIAEENKTVNENKWSYRGRAAAKVIINSVMTLITAYTAHTYGVNPSMYLLSAWCLSKLITLGDGSPTEHFECSFSLSRRRQYSPQRSGLFMSLGNNLSATSKATFYGMVALATTATIPYFGQITIPTAGLLTVVPLIVRINQIRIMAPVIGSRNQKYYNAKALVDTLVDMGMGAIIYYASLVGDVHITTSVLAGWIGAKITSSGDNSPLDHLSGFGSYLLGAGEAAPPPYHEE